MLHSSGSVRAVALVFLCAAGTFLLGVGHELKASDITEPQPVETTDVAPPHDATIGSLAGTGDTIGGAATYSVPIVVPPGRAGMQPTFSLEYNSRSGNGVVGLGWAISGGSSIHRCPQTPEQDGQALGVSYTNNDRLCLDGQRLVRVGGTYGAAGAEYRTEIDSYARIYQAGGDLASSGVCFRVEEKSGRIRHYGAVVTGVAPSLACASSSANARVIAGGRVQPLSWLVEKIEDRSGNNELYTYINFGYGEVYPSKVAYTGYGASAGDRSIEFAYVARTTLGVTDTSSSYLAGGLSMQTRALSSITTKVGSSLVRKVTLAYTKSVYSGRLMLENLTECAFVGAVPTCHPATSFSMADSELQYTPTSISDLSIPGLSGPTNQVEKVVVVGDLDGNGSREVVVEVQQSNGNHTYLAQLGQDHEVHQAVDLTGIISAARTGYVDIDSDGRTDLAYLNVSGPPHLAFRVWNLPRGTVATGNPFRVVESNVPLTLGLGVHWNFADFNGDGRTDVSVVAPSALCGSDSLGNRKGVFAQLNANPAGPLGATIAFTLAQSPLFCLDRSVSGTVVTEDSVEHVADFDGNGLPDHFIRTTTTSTGGATSWLRGVRLTQRVGTALSSSLRTCAEMGLVDAPGTTNDDCRWHQGYVTRWNDINGDGLEDFVIARPGQTWRVRLNTGGEFGTQIDTGSEVGLRTYSGGSAPFYSHFRYADRLPSMDVDADGREDLLIVSPSKGFAMKVCSFFKVNEVAGAGECPSGTPGGELPTGGANLCPAYACPEDPNGSGALTMPANQTTLGGYTKVWHDMEHPNTSYPVFGMGAGAPNQSGLSGDASLADASIYHLAALRFVQTGPLSIQALVTETPLISRVRATVPDETAADDLYGDGLTDLMTYIGGSPRTETIVDGSVTYTFRRHLVVADGTWGPANLPDENSTPICVTSGGTTSCPLQSQTRPYVNVNTGANAFSLLLESVPSMDPGRNLVASIPSYIPGLMRAAEDGIGDFAAWAYAPLGAGFDQAGVPLYTVPSGTGYVDQRHYYFTSSMPVVTGMTRNDGMGGEYGFRSAVYGYGEAMYHHYGRGFQGFRGITTIQGGSDADHWLFTTALYHQKFPLTGKTAAVCSYTAAIPYPSSNVCPTPTLPGHGYRVRAETNTWICNLSNRAACAEGDAFVGPTGSTVFTPLLDRQYVSTHDPLTNLPKGYTETVNAATATGGASGWDAYGNLKNQTITSGDSSIGAKLTNHVVRTTNTYAAPNLSTWWVGKLDQSLVMTSTVYSANHAPPAGVTIPAHSVTTSYQWNTDRSPASQTVQPGLANQALTTTWQYPAPSYGLPSTLLVSGSAVTPSPRTTSFSYSKDGVSTAADGYFVLRTTNAAGHLTTTEHSVRDGQITRTIDPNNLKEAHTYDAFGRLTRTEYRDGGENILLPSRTVSHTRCIGNSGTCAGGYGEGANQDWAKWRVTQVQNGHPTVVDWYDVLGRNIKHAERGFGSTFVASFTEYDVDGNKSFESTPYFVGSAPAGLTGWSYDRLHRPVEKVSPGSELDPSHGDVVTTYSYLGNKTTIKVRGRYVSTTCADTTNLCMDMTRTHDALGRLLQTVQSDSTTANYAVTDYWYDGHGNPVAARDAEGNVIRASYNPLNHRTQVVDPDAGTWNFTYNALGELLTQTDARGVQTSHAYDAIGRLVQRTATNTSALDPSLKAIRDNWYWDPMGTDGGYGVLDYAQRLRGPSTSLLAEIWRQTDRYQTNTKRLSDRRTLMDGQAEWLTQYYYDTAGREQAVRYPHQLLVKKEYTEWGDLRQLSDYGTGEVYWTATAKDAWGNVTGETYVGNLTGTHTSYASTGQVKRKKWTSGATTLDQLDYTYDSFGNLATQSVTLAGATSSEAYLYDPLQRLRRATRTGVTGNPGPVNYQYRPSGNLSAKSDFSMAVTGSYQYGGNGCGPHGVSQVAQLAGPVTYACDANGNVVGGNTLSANSYDFENKPWAVSRVGEGLALFAYDANGDRFREEASSHTTWFGPSGYERSLTGGIQTTHRVELGPVTVTKIGSISQARANLRDRLGSTVALGGTGSLFRTRAYDAFGKVREGNHADRPNGTLDLMVSTLRGFTGHEHVDDVRLIHMNGRMYDYQLGRFLSVDPVIQFPANSQSLNPYSYIMNNPLSGRDPSGYFTCDEKGTCKGTLDEIQRIDQYKDGTVTATNKDGQTIDLGMEGDANVTSVATAFVSHALRSGANGHDAVQGTREQSSRDPASIESVAERKLMLPSAEYSRHGDAVGGAILTLGNTLSLGIGSFLIDEQGRADMEAFDSKYGGAAAALNLIAIARNPIAAVEKIAARGAANPKIAEALKRGQDAHKARQYPDGFKKEKRLPSGKQMDAYNSTTKEVRELKPNNPRAIARGEKQVEQYCRECDQVYGPGHTGAVETYDP